MSMTWTMSIHAEDGPSIFHAHEGLGLDLTWERGGGERRGKNWASRKRVSQSYSQYLQ